MKTLETPKSHTQESRNALVFLAFFFLLLMFAGKVSAANKIAGSGSAVESFTADCSNYGAVIKWTTDNDMVNSVFTIERTRDGVHFEIVMTVAAAPGQGKHEYSTMDESPMNGVSYYRICTSDTAGNTAYLNTVVYTPCENDDIIEAFNNYNDVYIQINATTPDVGTIVLKDIKGKIIVSEKRNISLGLNNFRLKPALDKGVYILEVKYGKYKLNKALTVDPVKS